MELRSIQDIRKEKSKRGVFSDAIKLVMKDRTEVKEMGKQGLYTGTNMTIIAFLLQSVQKRRGK